MHLLYLDESGSAADPRQRYFVLAGLSVFERSAHWVEQDFNEIAKRFAPQNPYDIELHGSPMRSGREGWKAHALKDRLKGIQDALTDGIAKRPRKFVNAFGVVIKKSSVPDKDPVDYAFEQIVSRFDLFLSRLHAKYGDTQRGNYYS